MIYRRLFDFPTVRMRHPFEEMERIRRQMDWLTESMFGRAAPAQGAGVFPLVNLTEDRDRYYVRAELPGVRAEDLDIQVTGKSLAISGERKIATEDPKVKYHRRERDAGRFSRILSLPGELAADRVEASLRDGILFIVIPKAEEAKPRQISVK